MESSNNQFHESLRQGLVAGYVFSATFFAVIYASYCVPTLAQLIKKKKYKKEQQTKAKQMHKLPHHQELTHKNIEKRKQARQIEKQPPIELLKRIEINKVARFACRMSFIKLCDATNYFSMDNAIGVGTTGIMYKARLPSGLVLAVKRLYVSELLNKQFELETMILGRYNHRNIVPLLGFCIEEKGKERILVYEYMSNGRLSDWLSCDVSRLEWDVVIRIALGVARGLCCLHHSLRMVHLNISSECILLEENFEPKISNFGGAVFLNHDMGTSRGFEEDVYGFGILLLELIKGKSFRNNKGHFATSAISLFHDPDTDISGFFDEMAEYLNEIEYEDEVSTLLRVACHCIHPLPYQRPTMLEVYRRMSNIWESDEIREESFKSNNIQPEPSSACISRDEIVELQINAQNEISEDSISICN